MLEDILGSRSKIRILRFLFADTRDEFAMEDIARGAGLSFGTVHPALAQLTDARILTVKKLGRSRIFRLNTSNRLYEQIRTLFKEESEGLRKLAFKFTVMSNKKGLKTVILFGSVAKESYAAEAGDVDLLFVCETDNDLECINKETSELSQQFLEQYDVVISPLCLSAGDVQERMDRSDGLILKVISEGKLMYGESEWLGM